MRMHDSRARRARRAAVPVALFAVTALLAGACVAPPSPPDPFGLRVALGEASLELAWEGAVSAPDGYEVQVGIGDGPWTPIGTTADTEFSYTSVTEGSWYRFRVGVPGEAWSLAVDAVYVVPVLPVVRIDTDGAAPVLDKENYVRSTVSIDPNGSGFAAFTGTAGIRGRGNSTWNQAKKPYKIKLDDKSELLGMAREKDWVLLANALDRSQLRTYAAGELGRATDLEWTPDSEWVEVVLNGEYLGVYQLAEQVEVKSRRLDIAEMEPEDVAGEALTGGYLLEIDARLEENAEPGFRTARNVPVVIKEPDPAQPEQFRYIRNHVQQFEDLLYSPGFADPATGYRSMLDVDSFIDWYLVEELTKNQDGLFSSSYFYKDRNELLQFGPLWDFDMSMGTTRGVVPPEPEGFFVYRPYRPWVSRFFDDPAFLDRMDERWDAFKATFDQLPADLVAVGAALGDAVSNDAARWRYQQLPSDDPQYLADWLTTRLAWMDAELDRLAASS